jgi:hypothetical protein
MLLFALLILGLIGLAAYYLVKRTGRLFTRLQQSPVPIAVLKGVGWWALAGLSFAIAKSVAPLPTPIKYFSLVLIGVSLVLGIVGLRALWRALRLIGLKRAGGALGAALGVLYLLLILGSCIALPEGLPVGDRFTVANQQLFLAIFQSVEGFLRRMLWEFLVAFASRPPIATEVPSSQPPLPTPILSKAVPITITAQPKATLQVIASPTVAPIARPPTSTPIPATATMSPVPDACPDSRAKITFPRTNSRLQGTVQIEGSAEIPEFWFYKLEYGIGDNPEEWHSISEPHYAPVTSEVLDIWNTDVLLEGVYQLRLTVVDITGNYPPQNICQVQIVIDR